MAGRERVITVPGTRNTMPAPTLWDAVLSAALPHLIKRFVDRVRHL